MKNFILLTTLVLNSILLFGQTEKSFIKIFPIEYNNIDFDIDGKKTIEYWNADYVKLELTISTNTTIEVLNSLTKTGRYDFEKIVDGGTLIISIPKLNKKIKIGEKELVEKVILKIWLPDKFKFQ